MVPPYKSSIQTIWSPDFNKCVIVEVAARPEEKARAYSAPSKAAKHFSRQSLDGLPLRPYSWLKNIYLTKEWVKIHEVTKKQTILLIINSQWTLRRAPTIVFCESKFTKERKTYFHKNIFNFHSLYEKTTFLCSLFLFKIANN